MDRERFFQHLKASRVRYRSAEGDNLAWIDSPSFDGAYEWPFGFKRIGRELEVLPTGTEQVQQSILEMRALREHQCHNAESGLNVFLDRRPSKVCLFRSRSRDTSLRDDRF